jgi:formylglycine-generating enzyme required for sulfatase activity
VRVAAIIASNLLGTVGDAMPGRGQSRNGPLSASEEHALKLKDTFRECNKCPEMAVAPAGSFIMGSPDTELNRAKYEGPQHGVTFKRQFAVGRRISTADCAR